MILKLYKTTDDKKVVGKNLTTETIFSNVTCHDKKNLLNPTFKISTNVDITQFNYAYCDKFKRYYYIDNIEYLNTGIYVLSCSVDVLKSNETAIRNLTATVKRNENNSNAYLLDSNYKTVTYSNIVTKQFPNGIENDSIILLTVG